MTAIFDDNYYKVADELAQDIIDRAITFIETPSSDNIKKIIWDTYIFAREAHGDQKRKSGEPYINHPLEATRLLLSVRPDLISIQACILHDVIEDTEKTEDDIRELFGDDVAKICQ